MRSLHDSLTVLGIILTGTVDCVVLLVVEELMAGGRSFIYRSRQLEFTVKLSTYCACGN
jgi:hypothetical protein